MIRQASVLEKLDKNHSKFGYRNKNKLIAQGSVLTAGGGFNPISKISQSTNERISRFEKDSVSRRDISTLSKKLHNNSKSTSMRRKVC